MWKRERPGDEHTSEPVGMLALHVHTLAERRGFADVGWELTIRVCLDLVRER